MPEFKKGNDWSNKFLSKSPYKKETRWEGPRDSQKGENEKADLTRKVAIKKMPKATIKSNIKKKEWEPAFPGADHSQEELDNMTKEEKDNYYG